MNDIDINEFDYKLAFNYDKRTFKQLYLSYICIKHPLLYFFIMIIILLQLKLFYIYNHLELMYVLMDYFFKKILCIEFI